MLHEAQINKRKCKKNSLAVLFVGGCGELLYAVYDIIQKQFDIKTFFIGVAKYAVGMSQKNYPLWFLTVFFVCKVVFDSLITSSNKFRHRTLVTTVVMIVSMVLGLCFGLLKNKIGMFLPYRFDIAFVMLPMFWIGYLFNVHQWDEKFKELIHRPYVKMISITVLTFVINFVAFKLNPQIVSVNSSEYGNPFCFVISSIFGSLFIIEVSVIFQNSMAVRESLSWYGKNSLLIMCTHALLLPFIDRIVSLFRIPINKGYIIFIMCLLIEIPVVIILQYLKGLVLNKRNYG